LRGLRLGMSYDTVKARFKHPLNKSRFRGRRDEFGFERVVAINFDSGQAESEFAGIQMIELAFLDGKLSLLSFHYDGATRWRNVDEFVEKVAPALKLPKVWDAPPYRFSQGKPINRGPILVELDTIKALKCAGFVVQADVTLGSELVMFDPTLGDAIKQREKAKLEKQKETFRP
jgi:hypothetical protein